MSFSLWCTLDGFVPVFANTSSWRQDKNLYSLHRLVTFKSGPGFGETPSRIYTTPIAGFNVLLVVLRNTVILNHDTPYVRKHDQTEDEIIGVWKFTLDHIVVYWFLCHPTQLFSEPIIAVPRSQIILIYIASTNLDYNSSINILLLLWKQTTSQQSLSGHGGVEN